MTRYALFALLLGAFACAPVLAGRAGEETPDAADAFPGDPIESLDRNGNGLGDLYDALAGDLRAASVSIRRALRRLPAESRTAALSAAQDLDVIVTALGRPLGSTTRTVLSQGRRFRSVESRLAPLSSRSDPAEANLRLASFRRYLERAGGDTAVAAYERERAESNAPEPALAASADPNETIRVLFESLKTEDASRLVDLLLPDFAQADASSNAYDRTGARNALVYDFRMLDGIDCDYTILSSETLRDRGARRVRIQWNFRARLRPNFEEWILRGQISTLELRLDPSAGWRIAKIEGRTLFARADFRSRITIDDGTVAGAPVTAPRTLTESGLE